MDKTDKVTQTAVRITSLILACGIMKDYIIFWFSQDVTLWTSMFMICGVISWVFVYMSLVVIVTTHVNTYVRWTLGKKSTGKGGL